MLPPYYPPEGIALEQILSWHGAWLQAAESVRELAHEALLAEDWPLWTQLAHEMHGWHILAASYMHYIIAHMLAEEGQEHLLSWLREVNERLASADNA